MMRFVRLTGGASGAIVAITLASGAPGFFDPSVAGRLLLAAWITAWTVIGYSIMPYITVQPAGRLVRNVMDLSTSEFVAAVGGLTLGLLMGVLLGVPLSHLPDPYGWMLPIGVSVVLGLGMLGSTVAKRVDLFEGLRSLGGFELSDEDAPGIEEVDGKLVSLARARNGAVLTTDYNLNRVAQLQGVRGAGRGLPR
jgi:uncharacterized protein YacL